MIYGLTKGTDFEKLCDGAAKAEAAGVMTYYALARMAKEQGHHGVTLRAMIAKYKK